LNWITESEKQYGKITFISITLDNELQISNALKQKIKSDRLRIYLKEPQLNQNKNATQNLPKIKHITETPRIRF
jgi:hypothetical protein